MISELGIGIAISVFGLALNAFWKRALHICIYSKTSLTDHLHDPLRIGPMVSRFREVSMYTVFFWCKYIDSREDVERPSLVYSLTACLLNVYSR